MIVVVHRVDVNKCLTVTSTGSIIRRFILQRVYCIERVEHT